jgi:hypothetical protein
MTRSEAEELWGLIYDMAERMEVVGIECSGWRQFRDACELLGMTIRTFEPIAGYRYMTRTLGDSGEWWRLRFLERCGVPEDERL